MTHGNTSEFVSLKGQGEPKYFDLVACTFVAIYLISQVASAKLIAFGPFQVPGAIVVFPISYIFGDILTEVYGYARTRRVIWSGLIAAVILASVLTVVEYLPPSPNWPLQAAYTSILGFVPRIVLGSIMAYWAGEFVNSFVMAKMKVWTQGRKLWTRTIGSTVVGQLVDSIVFVSIAFSGVLPIGVIAKIAGSTYVLKVGYEVLATPFTYIIVAFLKRREGIDVYDQHTDFSPFRF